MNMSQEIFKDIEGFEGRFQISSSGNVRGVDRVVLAGRYYRKTLSKKIKTSLDKGGYVRVNFNLKGKTKSYRIHRLVAEAFIPNPENKPQVNHINGIKADNRLENLEWCTCIENIHHAYKIGIRVSTKGSSFARINSETVLNLDYGIRDAANSAYYSHSHLRNMLIGRQKNKTNLIII
jgi:hypothetical protein